METETKLKINLRLFAFLLVIVIIVCAYLFYQQEQLARQQQQVQSQLIGLQQNFQQWQSNQLNNEASTLSTARALITQASVNLQSKQNPDFILNLLKAAQQQIVSFHDPKIVVLQKALQTDIAAVQQIKTVNLTLITQDINTLHTKITNLKFLEFEAKKKS